MQRKKRIGPRCSRRELFRMFAWQPLRLTDGQQAVNKMGPLEIKSTLEWVGKSLVISSRFIFNDADVSSEARWTLSRDGKTLTTSTRFKGSLGDSSQKLVFEKREVAASTPAKAAP